MDYIYYHNLDPIMIDLGFISIRYYGFFFASVILIIYFWIARLWAKYNATQYIDDFAFLCISLAIIFSRVFHIIFYDLSYFIENPKEIIAVWHGGLASHGGIFGVVLGIFLGLLLMRYRKIDNSLFRGSGFRLLDTFYPVVLLMIFIRLGNFMNGEVVGKITDFPIAVSYDYSVYQIPTHLIPYYKKKIIQSESFRNKILRVHETSHFNLTHQKLINLAESNPDILLSEILSTSPRHFAQFYEGIAALINLIFLYVFHKKAFFPPGTVFSLSILLSFVARFFLEFFKEYQSEVVLPKDNILNMGHYLSFPYILGSLIFIGYIFYKKKNQNWNLN